MVCQLCFKDGRLFFRNRYVQTKGYVDEQAAGRPLYKGAFSTGNPAGGWFNNPLDLKFKNVANTHVTQVRIIIMCAACPFGGGRVASPPRVRTPPRRSHDDTQHTREQPSQAGTLCRSVRGLSPSGFALCFADAARWRVAYCIHRSGPSCAPHLLWMWRSARQTETPRLQPPPSPKFLQHTVRACCDVSLEHGGAVEECG